MALYPLDPVLTALVGALIPGSGDWLAGSETQAPAFLTRRAAEWSGLARSLDALRALLPADFVSRDPGSRITVLREIEARIPEAFAEIVTETYRGYYTDARVLAVIERKTGYPARPPQPLGRKVRTSDWSVLADRSIAPAPLTPLPDTSGRVT